MKNEKIRLNPFVYISETVIRFYSLVLICILMPSQWALISVISFSIVGGAEITVFQRLLIVVLIVSFIPILIYCSYRRFQNKIIKESKLREFGKKKFPDHFEYIEKLLGEYLSSEKKPTLMYQPFDTSQSAFTFGIKNHVHISISGGLIKKFRKNIDGFKSIFLHEMGHIANRDVEKTYMADSAWKSSLFLTLLIPFGIFLSYVIYLILEALFFGIIVGYDMDYLILEMELRNLSLEHGRITLYFLIFFGLVYVLRKQIIRLREFYADAKVLEWEESPEGIVKTLEESGGKQYSKFEILTKFHPNTNERIHVLKDNSGLFTPSLWVAFSIGFFYGLIESCSNLLIFLIFSDYSFLVQFEQVASSGVFQPIFLNIHVLAFSDIFIFPILMIAISSSFHKSILKDVFVDNTGYFSTATMLKSIKFSLVFSLGWVTDTLFLHIQGISTYGINIVMGLLLDLAKYWIIQAFYFSMALIFLLIFASMLIRRSFSKKEAERNFLTITILSSVLYLINFFVANVILLNKPMVIVFFLIFSVLAYIFIKIKDRRLCCPNCNNKISNLSGLKLNCPNCHHDLYSWAVYPFSKNSVS